MTEEKVKSKTPRPKKVKDFDKMAMVAPALSSDIFQPRVSGENENQNSLTTDSTAITEFSFVMNHEYSHQIINGVRKKFNLEKLIKLKEKNPKKYLEEVKKQVDEVFSGMEALNTHSNLFNVSLLIAGGTLLNDVEDNFKSGKKKGGKKKYMSWVRANFGHDRMRYFQHAKQLANMGEFAQKYAALGKNRLLEFDRLRKKLKISLEELLKAHPFIDLIHDLDGLLFKEHVDSIITHYRLKDSGIDNILFEQASLTAAMLHKSIKVKMVKDIKVWLDQFENQEKKQVAFGHFLLNKLAYPYNKIGFEKPPEETKESLNRLLGRVLGFNDSGNLENEDWVNSQKSKIEPDIIVKAHNFILNLAEKFSINLEEDDQDNNNNDENEGGTNDKNS
ncbi:hypothetical protein [Desulfobacula sp.]|uniref:hypothetical protein n=1 Tax=Desulfobacula sp. TaxID=2593537 RepID=UPI001D6D3CA5|nr:hypothetical protein [Desulfobacula sp.]MBT4507948.1 hypothetical protein [Desulfobacula sp.]